MPVDNLPITKFFFFFPLVRHKVKELLDFIQDDDRLRDERKKAKKVKDKYVGVSSDAMGFGGSSTYSK